MDDLEENHEHVSIRIVTTMVVSGDVAACQDEVRVTLQEPLGDRDVIDTESGETPSVVRLDAHPRSLEGLHEDTAVAWAEDAIDTFVATGGDFLADASFEGQQILYEGDVVERLSVTSLPARGHLVTSAEWCYPDDY